jgi:hypothetical protein
MNLIYFDRPKPAQSAQINTATAAMTAIAMHGLLQRLGRQGVADRIAFLPS